MPQNPTTTTEPASPHQLLFGRGMLKTPVWQWKLEVDLWKQESSLLL